MKRPRLRDVWRFTRPAGNDGQAHLIGGSSWCRAERWTVAVWEVPSGGYKPVFHVQAALRAIEVPPQWHRDPSDQSEPWPGWRLAPAYLERVPCRVPGEPYTFASLAGARKKARELALIMSGRMHWTDVRFRAYGADA